MMKSPQFFTYILTNWNKTVLYVGFTNNLYRRLLEHYIGKPGSFTSKYKAHYLVWFEETKYVLNAIHAEKEIKSWSRDKKFLFIKETNLTLRFMNEDIIGNWPPSKEQLDNIIDLYKKGDWGFSGME